MKTSTVTGLLLILFAQVISGQSYTQSGGNVTKSGQTYTSTSAGVPGVMVTLGGVFHLSDSKVNKSGNTTYDGTLSASSYLNQKIYTLQNGCTLTCPTCTTWGIGDPVTTAPAVCVYPNPCSSVAVVSKAGSALRHARLYNILGIKQFEVVIAGTASIDVSTLDAGMYFLLVDHAVKRIVVAH